MEDIREFLKDKKAYYAKFDLSTCFLADKNASSKKLMELGFKYASEENSKFNISLIREIKSYEDVPVGWEMRNSLLWTRYINDPDISVMNYFYFRG